MSTSLYWREPPREPDGELLGYDLKWVIAKKYLDHDGTLQEDWFDVGKDVVPFLEGVIAATVGDEALKKEAQELIDLIEKYGTVQLSLRG